MNGKKLIDRFQFKNDGIFYYEIHSEAAIQLNSLVRYRQLHLSFETQTTLTQLIAETFLINRLHQPGPRNPMDLNRSANNRSRNLIQPKRPGSTCYLCPLCALRF